MTAGKPEKQGDPEVFGLISALGVPISLILFIWFFKAYIYDAPLVTTFLDAGMLFSPRERLLIRPIAGITLLAALLASHRSGRSVIRPGTYIPALILTFLGLLEIAPVRRAAVSFYFHNLDADISRIETQVQSIFHPAYGDVLTTNLQARARIKQAAQGGSFITNKDAAALILYTLHRLEGKSALQIAFNERDGLEHFLRVLDLEKESPYAGRIKPPAKIAPRDPEDGFQSGFIQRGEARAVFAMLTNGNALNRASLAQLIRMRVILGARPKLAPKADARLVQRLRDFFGPAAKGSRGKFFRELIRLAALVAKPDGTPVVVCDNGTDGGNPFQRGLQVPNARVQRPKIFIHRRGGNNPAALKDIQGLGVDGRERQEHHQNADEGTAQKAARNGAFGLTPDLSVN